MPSYFSDDSPIVAFIIGFSETKEALVEAEEKILQLHADFTAKFALLGVIGEPLEPLQVLQLSSNVSFAASGVVLALQAARLAVRTDVFGRTDPEHEEIREVVRVASRITRVVGQILFLGALDLGEPQEFDTDIAKNPSAAVQKLAERFGNAVELKEIRQTLLDIAGVESDSKDYFESEAVGLADSITIYYSDGSVYHWDAETVGQDTIDTMILLGYGQDGLNGFIHRNVRLSYR